MSKYTKSFSIIHWVHALIIAMVLVGGVVSLPELPASGEQLAPFKNHMIMGFVVFVVLIIRVVLLKKQPTLLPLKVSAFREKLIKLNHRLLYIFIGFSAISGMATAKSANIGQVLIFGKEPSVYSGAGGITATLGQIHTASAYILAALIVMHIAGVVSYALKGNRDIIQRVSLK
jgi:cytochrome b561